MIGLIHCEFTLPNKTSNLKKQLPRLTGFHGKLLRIGTLILRIYTKH